MKEIQLSFISFEPEKNRFRACFPLGDFILNEQDYEKNFSKAEKIYESSIKRMLTIVNEMNNYKQKHRRLPAQIVWELGDTIFELQKDLNCISLQIDGLYHHLVRDLGLKRKWLEKVIILRRYIEDKKIITESMNWSKFEKGTKKVALDLCKEFNINKNV